MPDFLCENVGQMLVVLHDKVRFCVYSGIRTYPSAYTAYALGYNVKYRVYFTLYYHTVK